MTRKVASNKKDKHTKMLKELQPEKDPQTVDAWWSVSHRQKLLEENAIDHTRSIMLKFMTKQPQYAIPRAPISIRENNSSNELNTVIRKMLQDSGFTDEVPLFEFVLLGKLLMGTLEQHLKDVSNAPETTFDLEYFERHPPPAPKDCLEHDDWVASVAASNNWLLTGCYDKTVHLWSMEDMFMGKGKEAHKLSLTGHKAPVKVVSWLQSKQPNEPHIHNFVSGSIDQSAIVWQWDDKKNEGEMLYDCRGHSQSVECIAYKKTWFATGSWDCSIKVWNPYAINTDDRDDTEPEPKLSKKNRKLKTPKLTLAGHTEGVSGLSFLEVRERLLSCSWDHSIRLWDLVAGKQVIQINGNVSYLCLSYSQNNRALLAGCADRVVRLYDPRSTVGNIVLNKYVSHKKWVSSVQWSANDDNLFVTAGYDNAVRLWDRRSAKAPLYDMEGHTDKALSVSWANPRYIASGSADCTALVFSSHKPPQKES